jgi:hypothetical protein
MLSIKSWDIEGKEFKNEKSREQSHLNYLEAASRTAEQQITKFLVMHGLHSS